ncbi:hypothetical protein FVE85_8437 [Porphyridium purpureum]|uniref:Hemerythrin-like domain-containing protein n=1 Tax=Porphyridium purpureum TaxID=35688 RepID=A0A5J4YLD5_PORPP|nr:hypothetical protein FVE85_8437 [Porphyridium purpureum]|eukprot:POR7295..scf244_11
MEKHEPVSHGRDLMHPKGEGMLGDDVAAAYAAHPFTWEKCSAMLVGQWEGGNMMQCVANWPQGLNMSVLLDRPLTWDIEKQEWRWHKTWRLPEITIHVTCPSVPAGVALEVRLNVVCAGSHAKELVDVGLVGPDGKPFVDAQPVMDGQCRFARLRLLGTSNTHGGKRFHIAASLLSRRSDSGRPEVVASAMSTGFSVYSRKDADKKRKKVGGFETTDDGGFELAYDVFSPELFTKTFVKKVNDHNSGTTLTEVIDNSWLGLMRYFQAPNIRFKSRHPILLATRFSNVIQIMRDCQKYPIEDETTLRRLLAACGFPHRSRGGLHESASELDESSGIVGDGEYLTSWMFTFRADLGIPPEAMRWLVEHMNCVKSPSLGFVSDSKLLPSHFIATTNLSLLIDVYCKIYALEYANRDLAGFHNMSPHQSGGQQKYVVPVIMDPGITGAGYERRMTDGSLHGAGSLPSVANMLATPKTQTRSSFQIDSDIMQEPTLPQNLPSYRGREMLEDSEDDADSSGGGDTLAQQRGCENAALANEGSRMMDTTDGRGPTIWAGSSGNNNAIDVNATVRQQAQSAVKASFGEYYIGMHSELRTLLNAFTDAASNVVASMSDEAVMDLRSVYYEFTESVARHAHVEDSLLFPALTRRVPGVAESYTYDHYKQSHHLTQILETMNSVNASNAADLFLQISSFAAVHEEHMEKEEEHLLPYFLSVFSDQEIYNLMQSVSELMTSGSLWPDNPQDANWIAAQF